MGEESREKIMRLSLYYICMMKIVCDKCKNEAIGKSYKMKLMDGSRCDIFWTYDLCEKCRDEIEKEMER